MKKIIFSLLIATPFLLNAALNTTDVATANTTTNDYMAQTGLKNTAGPASKNNAAFSDMAAMPETGAGQDLVSFLKMEKQHKADWAKFKKDFHNAKFDLCAKHHQEIFDNKIKLAEKAQNGNIDIKQFLADSLSTMKQLHKKQLQEMHDLCMKWHKKAEEMYQKEMKELDKSFAAKESDLAMEPASSKEGLKAKINKFENKLSEKLGLNKENAPAEAAYLNEEE